MEAPRRLPDHLRLTVSAPCGAPAWAGSSLEQIRLEGVDESYPTDLPLEEIPLYIARVKAEAYRPLLGERTLLITADTLVFIGDKVLGKPRDAAEAKAMLAS